MTSSDIMVRPVRLSDVSHLQENCFSVSTLGRVQSRVEAGIREYEDQKGFKLVAEIDGIVVGDTGVKPNSHPLEAHLAHSVVMVAVTSHTPHFEK